MALHVYFQQISASLVDFENATLSLYVSEPILLIFEL